MACFDSEENMGREPRCRGFCEAVLKLQSRSNGQQAYTGQMMLMACQRFFELFGNVPGFRARPRQERRDYLADMIAMENGAAGDPHTVVALFLFRCWVWAVHEEDRELEQWFSPILEEFMEWGRKVEAGEATVPDADLMTQH